jgi:hypothetical protein
MKSLIKKLEPVFGILLVFAIAAIICLPVYYICSFLSSF